MHLKILSLLPLATLVACDAPTSRDAEPSAQDTFHEKSFSWDDPGSAVSLARIAGGPGAKVTRFDTPEALHEAVLSLEEKLRGPGFSDSLWKPLDYACDEVALAVWNVHGTVAVGDSVVFDEGILKAGCRYVGEDPGLQKSGAGRSGDLAKTMDDFEGAVVNHREYPYKMIGESWDDFNIGVYRSTGGETQFKKHRSKLGIKAWYDTDATRIGVRIYLLNCSVSGPKTCYVASSHKDWYANDDYVSKRDYGIGVVVKMTRPTPQNGWTASPTGAGLMDFKVSDAVISMHSADHAGIQFRAMSRSGIPSNAEVVGPTTYSYVTW